MGTLDDSVMRSEKPETRFKKKSLKKVRNLYRLIAAFGIQMINLGTQVKRIESELLAILQEENQLEPGEQVQILEEE